jgi:hypothetical protein
VIVAGLTSSGVNVTTGWEKPVSVVQGHVSPAARPSNIPHLPSAPASPRATTIINIIFTKLPKIAAP